MERYQLIEASSNEEFDAICNKLSKEGWFPCWPVVISSGRGGVIGKYVQQWSTFNPETKPKNFNVVIKDRM